MYLCIVGNSSENLKMQIEYYQSIVNLGKNFCLLSLFINEDLAVFFWFVLFDYFSWTRVNPSQYSSARRHRLHVSLNIIIMFKNPNTEQSASSVSHRHKRCLFCVCAKGYLLFPHFREK